MSVNARTNEDPQSCGVRSEAMMCPSMLSGGSSGNARTRRAANPAYTSPLHHTREYLTVLRPLLNGRPVRFDGEFFTVDTRLGITAPASSLLMSALGPRMLEPAHDLADGVAAAWVTPDMVARHIAPRTAPARASWPKPSPCSARTPTAPAPASPDNSPRSAGCPPTAPRSSARDPPAPPTHWSSETAPPSPTR
ncbi:LLM class flavin-dependent oxidoreductase [Amycolatopsis sp. NPDC021455]|uniref:LLM class flavin-dependent oxidoreductase n=1 Tax=Amycolatopsis sp. NPDC021455 TaxID=3154901 RepID=UPI00341070B3